MANDLVITPLATQRLDLSLVQDEIERLGDYAKKHFLLNRLEDQLRSTGIALTAQGTRVLIDEFPDLTADDQADLNVALLHARICVARARSSFLPALMRYGLQFARVYSKAAYRTYQLAELERSIELALRIVHGSTEHAQLFIDASYHPRLGLVSMDHSLVSDIVGRYFDKVISVMMGEQLLEEALVVLKRVTELGALGYVAGAGDLFHRMDRHVEGACFLSRAMDEYLRDGLYVGVLDSQIDDLKRRADGPPYTPRPRKKTIIGEHELVRL